MHSSTALDVSGSEEAAAQDLASNEAFQQTYMKNLCPFFWLCSVIREKDFKDSTVWVGLTPLALTDGTSGRRMQQRKTGKCQERLTKHIAQRLPFKSKTGRGSNTHTQTHRLYITELDAFYQLKLIYEETLLCSGWRVSPCS